MTEGDSVLENLKPSSPGFTTLTRNPTVLRLPLVSLIGPNSGPPKLPLAA